jgi:ASC-1-like (ASCH) protein
LQESGFDPKNPEHLLIVCGDCFDRGRQNRAVLEYLRCIPNKVLIRGNHEDMLMQAMERGSIGTLEVANGTIHTIQEFFGAESIGVNGKLYLKSEIQTELSDFIGEMVDYFETEHYVFTHGWVPLDIQWGEMKLRRDWRTASVTAWEQARFIGWNKVYQQRLTLSDKTVVCGHRGAHYGHSFDSTRAPRCHDPFYGKGLIAIDALTVASNQVNILVLEEEVPTSRIHSMKLQKEHFDHIAEGSKIIEMRLYDEKRRKIRLGDTIEFTCDQEENQTVRTKVQGLYVYPGFDELVEDFTPTEMGFSKTARIKISEYMLRLYGVEAAFKNKAIAIKVKVMENDTHLPQ